MSARRLLSDGRFGPLFWTQFLGALNDNLFKTAFVLIITYGSLAEAHDARHWAPLLNGLLILPFFLFSAAAGQIADKMEKAGLIRWIKLGEVVVMAVAALGFLTDDAWLLAGALFLMGAQSAFFGPVKYSILPQTLSRDALVSANAWIGTATFLAILLGSMGGGLLMETESAATVTAILVVLIAAAGFLVSRRIPKARASAPGLRFDWNPFRQTLRVCRDASANRVMWRSILGVSWFWFFGASLLTVFPTYGRNILHADEQVVTLFLIEFCIGIGLGALVCARLARHRLELGLVPVGALGLSVFALDLFLASLAYQPAPELVGLTAFLVRPGSARIVIDLLGLAVCGGLYIVPLNTLVQARAPETCRSRILSGNGIVSALFMVVSAAMILVFAAIGIPSVFVFLVLACMNAAVVIYILGRVSETSLRLVVFTLVRTCYRLRVLGLDNVPREGPVVLAANHVSYVDGLVLSAAVARPIRFVMYHKFGEMPLLGRALKRARVIPIASGRENPALLEKAYDDIAKALRAGEVVCIFPEGRLTGDGTIRSFKKGVERIVARTPVPVVPLRLQGLWGSMFSRAHKRFRLWRLWSRIDVLAGAPVPADQVSAASLRERVAGLV